jgi:hypothetical protein
MKKMAIAVAVVAVLAVAGAAKAFDIPTKVPTSASDVKDTAMSVGGSVALQKKVDDAKCTSFKANTAEANCDVKKLANELAAVSKASKELAKANIYVTIEAGPGQAKKKADAMSANDRANAVRDQLKSGLGGIADSWRYNTSTASQTNKLAISVKVEK